MELGILASELIIRFLLPGFFKLVGRAIRSVGEWGVPPDEKKAQSMTDEDLDILWVFYRDFGHFSDIFGRSTDIFGHFSNIFGR